MATTRATFTLDKEIARRARELGVNVSAAARDGVTAALREAMLASDIAAYQRHPEKADPFWEAGEAWGDE